MSNKHTVRINQYGGGYHVYGPKGEPVAWCSTAFGSGPDGYYVTLEDAKANAELICDAFNSKNLLSETNAVMTKVCLGELSAHQKTTEERDALTSRLAKEASK